MKLHGTKEFPYSLETGWAALHSPAKLDVEPGSRVEVPSDTEWLAHNETNGKEVSCTHYIASFDEEKKQVIIESKSDQKMDHDHIYLTLTQPSDDHIQLEIQIEISTGVHFIAKALGALIAKPTQEIVCRHIFQNFEALCTGGDTKTLSQDDLSDMAKKYYSKEK